MLVVRVSEAVEPADATWCIEALVVGLGRSVGALNVVGALTDLAATPSRSDPPSDGADGPSAPEQLPAVLVELPETPDDQRAGNLAAAEAVVVIVGPDELADAENQRVVAAVVINASGEQPSGVRRWWPSVAQHKVGDIRTCEVDLRQPKTAARLLRRLGRQLAELACAPQRLGADGTDVRRRSAAEVAVSSLEALLGEPDVEEFQIRGGEKMEVRLAGRRYETRPSPFASDDDLVEAVRFLAAYSGDRSQRFDELDPRLDVRVGDSWRLHAEAFVTSPPNVVLRSNMAGRMRIADLGVACEELQALLVEAIAGEARANVVVAASMGGGKTTLCQALLAAVPDHERIDTIEDTPELRLSDYGIHPNAYERLTRDPNQDGHGRHSMADHIRDAKRSNAQKLVVGEIRGEGCDALLDAMSSGISGCLVTLHSMPGKGVLEKLVAYACAEGAESDYARRQIATAVDLCVWMGTNETGQRVVADVTQLTGIDQTSGVISTKCLWALHPGERWARPVGVPVGRVAKTYAAAGIGEGHRQQAALPLDWPRIEDKLHGQPVSGATA